MATPDEHEQALIDLAFRFKHGWIPLNPSVNKDERGLAALQRHDAEQHIADYEGVAKAAPWTEHRARMTKILGREPSDDEAQQTFTRLKARGLVAGLAKDSDVSAAQAREHARHSLADAKNRKHPIARGLFPAKMDLAKPGQRYTHGWVPLHDALEKTIGEAKTKQDETDPYAGMRRLEAEYAKSTGSSGPPSEGLLSSLKRHHAKAVAKRAEKRLATDRMIAAQKGKGGGKAGAQSEFDRAAAAARARKAANMSTKDADKAVRDRMNAIDRNSGRKKHHGIALSNLDVELASNWGAYNAKRAKKGVRPKAAFHDAHPAQTAVHRDRKAFAKTTGTSIAGAQGQALLASRASKPGHFRAKAILAAQNGNMKAAKRFEAKRVVAKAQRTKPTGSAFHQAPAPAKPHPASVVKPAAPVPTKPHAAFQTARPVKTLKAPTVRGPRKIKR